MKETILPVVIAFVVSLIVVYLLGAYDLVNSDDSFSFAEKLGYIVVILTYFISLYYIRTKNENKKEDNYDFNLAHNTELDLKLRKHCEENHDDYDFSKEISKADAEILQNDVKYNDLIYDLLSDIEFFCGAYNAGVVDKEKSYQLYAPYIIEKYYIFSHCIKMEREKSGNQKALISFEEVAKSWRDRREYGSGSFDNK